MIISTLASRKGVLRHAALGAAFLVAGLAPSLAVCQIMFDDVSDTDGINYVGESWGAAWGDFNGDGRPDLWTSNHGEIPGLWLNNGDGTFTNIAPQVLPPDVQTGPVQDEHGAAWADFDNDGDQDLIQLVSGGARNQPNRMYVNDGGMLVEQAEALNLALNEGRGRTPLWFDYNHDGVLDLFITTATQGGIQPQTPTLNLQTPAGFVDSTEVIGLNLTESTRFAMRSNIFGDAVRELLIAAQSQSLRAYATQAQPFDDISDMVGFGTPRGMIDGVAADLTGNLVPDIYTVQGGVSQNALITNEFTVEAHLTPRGSEEGFQFNTTGDVLFELYPSILIPENSVFIGAVGFHPEGPTFSVSPDDPMTHGIPDYTPGVSNGIYLGYAPKTSTWTLVVSTFGNTQRNVVAVSDAPVSALSPIGFAENQVDSADAYFVRDAAGVYQDETIPRGINTPSVGRNIGVGDFDNDMDFDLYIVATGPVENLPNLLYQNDGSGNFTAVADAGGAAGGSAGRGDAVAVADYDGDGFLDIFITNGKSKPPFDRDGPYNLFRNLGGDNNWLEVDLEGIVSNRDGIGATLLAAAGGITQLREYGNETHFRAQNHRRAHFGLADNTKLDQLTITWPSGITQVLEDVPANQRIRVIEPASATTLGKPKFEPGVFDGLYLWQDESDGTYRLRASGGEGVSFRVYLVSQAPLGQVTPVKLGRNDRLTLNEFGFDVNITVNNSENGVDFELPAGVPTMIAVEREGVVNPRLLSVGANGGTLATAGWIVSSGSLPPLPGFVPGTDMGLHFGTTENGNGLSARWTGDEFSHQGRFLLTADKAISAVVPVSLEAIDELTSGANFVDASGGVTGGQDGVDLQLSDDSLVGIAYLHDGLFQTHRINMGESPAVPPNAMWLIPPQQQRSQGEATPATGCSGKFHFKAELCEPASP